MPLLRALAHLLATQPVLFQHRLGRTPCEQPGSPRAAHPLSVCVPGQGRSDTGYMPTLFFFFLILFDPALLRVPSFACTAVGLSHRVCLGILFGTSYLLRGAVR